MIKQSYQILKGNGTEDVAFWTVESEDVALFHDWEEPDEDSARALIEHAGLVEDRDFLDIAREIRSEEEIVFVFTDGVAVRFC